MEKVSKIAALCMAVFILTACNAEQSTEDSVINEELDPEPVEEIGDAYDIQGRDHVYLDEEHDAYNSNPPTSGWHTGESVPWGFYGQEYPDEQLIHNLEHGGIWITYKDIDDHSLEQIKAFAEEHSGSVVVTPRPQNDSQIVVASWGRLLKMDTLDMPLIEEFYKQYKNNSPEKLAGE